VGRRKCATIIKKTYSLNWQGFVIEAVKRRKEQKLTQEQLAVLAGISKPTLNSFEQGKTTIKLDSALKILKVLGLS
jgi:transcriptional regulator with XRE-family HTH domain